MYTNINFQTKKSLKEAIAAGHKITVYQPGLGTVPVHGKVFLEGPHYPEMHTWYAQAELRDGLVIKVNEEDKMDDKLTRTIIIFLILLVGWFLGYLHCWIAFK